MRILLLFLLIPLLSMGQNTSLFQKENPEHTMSERWELDPIHRKGTFLLSPYKPIFVLPVRWSSKPNERPYSGNGSPDYVAEPGVNYNNIESKLQFSFKAKVAERILWGKADLWIAYTQKSHWQLYNAKLSRPFREINYEPEVILNVPVNFSFLGIDAKMVGVAFNHESNGKSLPFSRSWNRIIFHAGFESGNWSFYIRPWLRLRQEKDENPDINKYIGKADINVIYTKNGNVFSFIGSHNLQFDQTLRGGGTFSWSYPIQGNLKAQLQISHGFGETLIDYNNVQTTIGIGICLVEWL
ncbi:phospholipase A [Flavobacterium sp.]|uniref:phospholipase A n=1 Tax=Flavobacterium sp. TaxID=239 RepID=UPI00260F6C97|nr:phospholipase A [Flavobacterium sp.]MDD3004146.1 phospholipase A [Flavobacterium sp.]